MTPESMAASFPRQFQWFAKEKPAGLRQARALPSLALLLPRCMEAEM
jgi:hypothetical protein